MVQVDYITYLCGGVAVKFRLNHRILLPITLSAHREDGAYLPGEWKVCPMKKSSPFSWYRRKKLGK